MYIIVYIIYIYIYTYVSTNILMIFPDYIHLGGFLGFFSPLSQELDEANGDDLAGLPKRDGMGLPSGYD